MKKMPFFLTKMWNSETKMFKGKICFIILKLIFQTTKEKNIIQAFGCSKNLVI